MNVILDISNKRWMDEQEAEIYTTMCTDILRKKREENVLPFRKLGRKIIYEKRDLDEMMDNLEMHIDGKVRKERKRNRTKA